MPRLFGLSIRSLGAATLLAAATIGAGSCAANPNGPGNPATPEAFCAQLDTGTGPYFYCPSFETNLQGGLPNGWLGACFVPARSFAASGGYSGYTTNGGRFPVVPTIGEAQSMCGSTVTSGGVCSGITLCTRP
jgi:hypothetical protein